MTKCRQLLGDFIPQAPTRASPLDHTGNFSFQTPSFVESKKILKLYYANRNRNPALINPNV